MLTTIIIITSIIQILVSLFVFLRGWRNLSYFLFFLIGIATLGWALSNYLAIVYLNSLSIIYIVRIILFFVVIQNACFYLFARTFPNTSWKYSKKWLLIYLLFTLMAAVATVSPYVFTSVVVKDGLPVTKAGPAILIFITHAGISIALAFKALIKKARVSTGTSKNQLQLLLVASFLTWIIVPITNFAITPLLKTTVFIKAGPLYTLAFASLIAYAIVAQKLFDIKLVVARSVAYILSLGLMVLGYATTSSLIVDRAFSNLSNGTLGIVFNAFVFLSAVIFYPHVQNFFDRVTNKLFYRDAYDTQGFLDELNGVLASTIELEVLLRQSSEVIGRNLKAGFCGFIIRETSGSDVTLTGISEQKMDSRDLEHFRESMKSLHDHIIIVDDLENTPRGLRAFLSRKDIAIVIRLISTTRDSEGVGYLLLGYKKSGNPYTAQDIRNMEIIANELVIAIQNTLRFEEIQGFNATLQEKINNATHRLRHINEKLKALDETKDEFISMASHQLRTPLTSVKGYLSMVLEGDAGELSSQQHKLLDQAYMSSQRMVYLIADLLNVSRLHTGKFVIEPLPTNLAEVVEGEVRQLVETAQARNLELVYDKPDKFPLLMLDETKIRQVVMNFVDNAIYYTPSGGHIVVAVRETAEAIEFTVVDDGLGVPKAEQHHLFTKFYRAGNARNARPDGTGLGLFMAKKVVVAQGGSLIFKSTEGKGSTFGFMFAKSRLAVPEISK